MTGAGSDVAGAIPECVSGRSATDCRSPSVSSSLTQKARCLLRAVECAQVRTICEHVLKVVKSDKGTANKEVVQRVVRLRALLRRGRFRQAEEMAYGILIEIRGLSKNGSDEEAAEDRETSKAPTRSVDDTVNIGRSIKFVRVAAGIKQGEMAKRLDISQN